MSPERQAQSTFTLFPLNESAIADGRVWLQKHTHSPDMLESEKEKMKNRDPDMYLFIYNMGYLRRIVQFEDDDKKQDAYWNGALYMLNALESSYSTLWKDFPHPSQEVMNTHFFNLLDVELNHQALENLAPGIFEDKKFYMLISDFLNGYGTKLFDEFVTIYGMNSLNNVHALFEQTPELEATLTRGSLQQTHGPALGLVYGAYDMHELFRLHDEGGMWEKTWDVPVR